jgi:thioredoxin reductase
MTDNNSYEVIIIGGSYAGLSAAMALGRSLRKVLILDSGKPCNRQTPHSHNFITHDGAKPADIAAAAKKQVLEYPTVTFLEGTAIEGKKTTTGFEITTNDATIFTTKKIILATGVKDIMPDIDGFAACWGISILHCPYCHGYEVRHEKTAVITNGDLGFEFTKMIAHWTKDLTLLTNGPSQLTSVQMEKLKANGIAIVETPIDRMEQENGYLKHIVFKDGERLPFKAVYTKPAFTQHSDIPASLGCTFTEQGHIQIDPFQKTTVPGVYACGDNSIMLRSVSAAVAAGNTAGAMVNKELIDEEF